MSSSYANNFTAALQERVGELAAAPDPQSVKDIVTQAETEARRRTEVPDTFVYRVTVLVLGFSIIAVIIAQMWLALKPAEIPEGLIAIGSAAVGALAGLLAPTPAN